MDEQTLQSLEPGTRVFCTLRAWSPEHLCEWCEAYVLLGTTRTHGRLQAVVVGLPKASEATGLADPYEQDGREHAREPVCVDPWNVHATKQTAADHSWELLVNQHKAMLRALGERCLPPCDPEGLHGFPVSAYCRATGDQRCHICEDADCGDNMTPSIVRLRQRPTVAACMQLIGEPSTPEAAAVAATSADLFRQTVDQDLCVVRDGASPGASEDASTQSFEAKFVGASDAVPEGTGCLVPLEDLQAAVPSSGPTLEERIAEPLEPPLWRAGGGRTKAPRKEPTAEERRAALLARLNGWSTSEGGAP